MAETVQLRVSHSVLPMTNLARRFPLDTPMATLVRKLQTFVGTDPAHMAVFLREEGIEGGGRLVWDGAEEANSNDNRAIVRLADVGAADGMELHVEDRDPAQAVAATQDAASAPKYQLSAEEYAARPGTYRAWRLEQQGGQGGHISCPQNTTPCPQPPASAGRNSAAHECPEWAVEGARVRLYRSEAQAEELCTATVRWTGQVRQYRGTWLGLELDEEGLAKGDGSSKGVRYFSCTPGRGIFVRPGRARPLQQEQAQGQQEQDDDEEL